MDPRIDICGYPLVFADTDRIRILFLTILRIRIRIRILSKHGTLLVVCHEFVKVNVNDPSHYLKISRPLHALRCLGNGMHANSTQFTTVHVSVANVSSSV